MTTSTFDKQAAASLDMIDEQTAAERVQKILHPEPQGARSQAQAGPTLTPALQTQPDSPTGLTTHLGKPAMNPPNRKPRSDKGIPKGPKASADPDEITIRMSLDEARTVALQLGTGEAYYKIIATRIQDQIIAQLQRRLDQLQKAPK